VSLEKPATGTSFLSGIPPDYLGKIIV
jgi:hypothetical protein